MTFSGTGTLVAYTEISEKSINDSEAVTKLAGSCTSDCDHIVHMEHSIIIYWSS